MGKEKSHIIAMRNGVPCGYIKSVSYTRKTFSLTQNKLDAKGYSTAALIQSEIDFLTSVGFAHGYVFIYD